jgi:hypothetical protein
MTERYLPCPKCGATDRVCEIDGGCCHPDCGPMAERLESLHSHNNDDGICWHGNNDMTGWPAPMEATR